VCCLLRVGITANAGSCSESPAASNPTFPVAGLDWVTSTLATDDTLRIEGGSVVSVRGIASVSTMASWSVGSSGRFDGSGRFNVAITVGAGAPQRFFRLHVPQNLRATTIIPVQPEG
jgi:hypothetical protein